jgi:L-rhamnonate dehydratase
LKITNVEAIYLRLPVIERRTDSSQDALLIKVTTDAGIVGWGEVDGCPLVTRAIVEAPFSHNLVTGLRELLVGEDPLETTALWKRMYEGTIYYGRDGAVIQAMAGIDLALWDIKGKALQKPVHQLLGGAFRDSIRVYASNMFQFTPEATAERARKAVDAGFTAVKFGWEPFGKDPETDVKFLAAIRGAIGETNDVILDVGLVWDAKTTIRRAKLFEAFELLWIEEPLHPDNLNGYARVSQSVDTYIAAGEEECTLAGFLRLMDQGKIDIVQLDMTRCGLTQAMKIAAAAEARGLRCVNHNFTTDINTAASLHFLAAIPNAFIMEYCVEPSELSRALVINPIAIKDGIARVPQEPGLGVEPRIDIIEKYRVAG